MKKYLTMSFDDGTTQDARLAEILRKYNLTATFNINTGLLGAETDLFPLGINARHLRLSENDIKNILTEMLYEFPVRDINFFMPSWINSLEPEHWLKLSIFDSVRNLGKSVRRIRETAAATKELEQNENITSAVLKSAWFRSCESAPTT